jgi:uncharacterized membrane protein YhdT
MSYLPTVKTKNQRFPLFLYVFTVVVLAIPLLLWLVGEFTLRVYFVFAFLWLLISSELFAPAEPESEWWDWLQVVKIAGWLIFAYIISERFLVVL